MFRDFLVRSIHTATGGRSVVEYAGLSDESLVAAYVFRRAHHQLFWLLDGISEAGTRSETCQVEVSSSFWD
jgi:hypothetical protein